MSLSRSWYAGFALIVWTITTVGFGPRAIADSEASPLERCRARVATVNAKYITCLGKELRCARANPVTLNAAASAKTGTSID